MNKYFKLLLVLSLFSLIFISPVFSYDFSNYKNMSDILNVIVVPIEFVDKVASTNISTLNEQVFKNMTNYFQNVSYGKISITGEVFDSWITLPQNMSFYGDYNGENDHSTG